MSVDRFAGVCVGGRFTIERLIARSRMGVVYRAWDEQELRSVALKVLAPDSVERARFERESCLLSGLEHEAIVGHVAHGRSSRKEPYLAMNWLEGPSLAERLAARPLSIDETLELGRRLLDALAYLHSRGVVHRDLKPGNILLVEGDVTQAIVIDFGIARWSSSAGATSDDRSSGTLGYMSPEQIVDSGSVDARADLFALGCVLYACLAGESPFAAPHYPAALAKLLLHEAQPLSDHRPDAPASLVALIHRLLSKPAADRPADAEQVRGELAAVKREPSRIIRIAERDEDPSLLPPAFMAAE